MAALPSRSMPPGKPTDRLHGAQTFWQAGVHEAPIRLHHAERAPCIQPYRRHIMHIIARLLVDTGLVLTALSEYCQEQREATSAYILCCLSLTSYTHSLSAR